MINNYVICFLVRLFHFIFSLFLFLINILFLDFANDLRTNSKENDELVTYTLSHYHFNYHSYYHNNYQTLL